MTAGKCRDRDRLPGAGVLEQRAAWWDDPARGRSDGASPGTGGLKLELRPSLSLYPCGSLRARSDHRRTEPSLGKLSLSGRVAQALAFDKLPEFGASGVTTLKLPVKVW